MAVGHLLMQRQWIMEPRRDATDLQDLADAIAFGDTNHEEVVDRPALHGLRDDPNLRLERQALAVTGSDGPASFSPVRELAQLDAQKRRLQRVETAVVALYVVIVLLRLTVLAQLAHQRQALRVGRRDGTGFAAGAEVLPRVKPEAGHVP